MRFAIELIVHTIKLIFNNLKQALHITLPALVFFIAAIALLAALFGTTNFVVADGEKPQVSLLAMLAIFAISILFSVVFSAVAVAWHRYVLLDEEPRDIFPLKLNRTALRYLWRSILIVLLLLLVAMVPIMIISPMMAGMSETILADGLTASAYIKMNIPMLLLSILPSFVFFRLMISLPAAALERMEFGIFDGWRSSRNQSSAIFWTVVITVTVNWLVGLAFTLPFLNSDLTTPPDIPLIVNLITIFWQWFAFMFSICIITTLYGICVEGREI